MLRYLQGLVLIGLLGLAWPVHAMDCKSDKIGGDAVLAAICNDPRLVQADRDMGDAYQNLFKGRDKQQQQVLKALQLDWLADERASGCGMAPSIDTECLLKNIRRRTDFLKGADGIGPASQGRLVFKGFYRDHKKPKDLAYSVSLFEFEGPDTMGKKAINAEAEAILAKSRRVGTGSSEGECSISSCDVVTIMRQPFQAKGFISVPIYTEEPGGIHLDFNTYYLNYFLIDNQPLALTDLLLDYDVPVLAKACYDYVLGGASELGGATVGDTDEDARPSNAFMGSFRDPITWRFDGQVIEVNFGLYTLGAYMSGTQSCSLSYEMLKPHLSGRRELPVAVN